MRTVTCTYKSIQIFTGSTTPASCTAQHATTNTCSFPLVYCQPIDRHIGQRHIRSFKQVQVQRKFRNRCRTISHFGHHACTISANSIKSASGYQSNSAHKQGLTTSFFGEPNKTRVLRHVTIDYQSSNTRTRTQFLQSNNNRECHQF